MEGGGSECRVRAMMVPTDFSEGGRARRAVRMEWPMPVEQPAMAMVGGWDMVGVVRSDLLGSLIAVLDLGYWAKDSHYMA